MTQWDEELGLPGNREIVEHALSRSTTQALHLAEETGQANRTLAERAADLVRGFECGPAVPAEADHAEPAVQAPQDDMLSDLADSLLRAETGVNVLCAGGVGAAVHVIGDGAR